MGNRACWCQLLLHILLTRVVLPPQAPMGCSTCGEWALPVGVWAGVEAPNTKRSHSQPCLWPAMTAAARCQTIPCCLLSLGWDGAPQGDGIWTLRGTWTGPCRVRLQLDTMSSQELQLRESQLFPKHLLEKARQAELATISRLAIAHNASMAGVGPAAPLLSPGILIRLKCLDFQFFLQLP